MRLGALLIILTFGISNNVLAQTITGDWNGVLEIGKMKLRIVFHIAEEEGKLSSTMDSPDQGTADIPVSETIYENGELTLKLPNLMAEYVGTFKTSSPDKIEGNFTQRGKTFPLELNRGNYERKRPQEPKPPYKYYSENVEFNSSKDIITLAGTLTKPKKRGKYKAVVLVTGSGPQNRNEEILGHKPFLVIVDYLTQKGYAVLRYDDRGVGGSGGDFSKATTYDLANDANAAVEYLAQRNDITEIGIIGHSEGGLIAPMVAAENKKVKTIIMLAGPGMKGADLLKLQQELIAKANGESKSDIETMKQINGGAIDIISHADDYGSAYGELNKFFTKTLDELADSINPNGASDNEMRQAYMQQYGSEWMFEFLRIDPADYLSKLECSVFALYGANDLQVPFKPNMIEVQKATAKAAEAKLKVTGLAHLNHLFQESKTGSPAEYAEIEQTFSPTALKEIETWLNQNL